MELSWIACGSTGVVGTFVTVFTAEATPSMSIPRRLLEHIPYSSVYVVPDDVPTVRIAGLMTGDQQTRLQVGSRVRLEAGDYALIHVHILD